MTDDNTYTESDYEAFDEIAGALIDSPFARHIWSEIPINPETDKPVIRIYSGVGMVTDWEDNKYFYLPQLEKIEAEGTSCDSLPDIITEAGATVSCGNMTNLGLWNLQGNDPDGEYRYGLPDPITLSERTKEYILQIYQQAFPQFDIAFTEDMAEATFSILAGPFQFPAGKNVNTLGVTSKPNQPIGRAIVGLNLKDANFNDISVQTDPIQFSPSTLLNEFLNALGMDDLQEINVSGLSEETQKWIRDKGGFSGMDDYTISYSLREKRNSEIGIIDSIALQKMWERGQSEWLTQHQIPQNHEEIVPYLRSLPLQDYLRLMQAADYRQLNNAQLLTIAQYYNDELLNRNGLNAVDIDGNGPGTARTDAISTLLELNDRVLKELEVRASGNAPYVQTVKNALPHLRTELSERQVAFGLLGQLTALMNFTPTVGDHVETLVLDEQQRTALSRVLQNSWVQNIQQRAQNGEIPINEGVDLSAIDTRGDLYALMNGLQMIFRNEIEPETFTSGQPTSSAIPPIGGGGRPALG